VNERQVTRDCHAALRRVLLDPHAPATTPDRLAGLQAALDAVVRQSYGDRAPTVALRLLAAQAMAWLTAIEERQ
jgi:hypothetical protein